MIGAALVAAALTGSAAAARPAATVSASATASAGSPEGLATTLGAAGYQVVLDKDGSGDPRLKVTRDAVHFVVSFFGCTEHADCTSIMFYYGRSTNGEVSVGRVNGWNKGQRWGRGYIDNDADPCLELDVDMTGGMPTAQFTKVLDHWWVALTSFREATA